MIEYMVLFDPLTHTEESFVPPPGVEGGITGDTETGLLAVYEMTEDKEAAFEAAVKACPCFLRCEQTPERDRRRNGVITDLYVTSDPCFPSGSNEHQCRLRAVAAAGSSGTILT